MIVHSWFTTKPPCFGQEPVGQFIGICSGKNHSRRKWRLTLTLKKTRKRIFTFCFMNVGARCTECQNHWHIVHLRRRGTKRCKSSNHETREKKPPPRHLTARQNDGAKKPQAQHLQSFRMHTFVVSKTISLFSRVYAFLFNKPCRLIQFYYIYAVENEMRYLFCYSTFPKKDILKISIHVETVRQWYF